MFRFLPLFLASMLLLSGAAYAKSLTYMIDHGTVGVITSKTEKVRLVIQASNNCKHIPYSVIADSVLASSGSFDLSKQLSMPMDYTVVTLSCNEKAVMASVEQANNSGPLGF